MGGVLQVVTAFASVDVQSDTAEVSSLAELLLDTLEA
jgi:hypothetical protein